MSRIAFVWELGSAYGHISLLLPFAKRLKARGHDVVLVSRELQNAGNLDNESIPILQSPLCLNPHRGLPERSLSYSDILLRYGYINAEGLTGLVGAWRSLFSLHGTDLIVADHSPTALLAARSMGLKATTLGTGFCLPPRLAPLPNMRPWLNVPRARLEAVDAHVLNSMNTVLTAHKAKPLGSVGELFETDANFLCTFPELDHYPQRAAAEYLGACYNFGMGQEVAWPEGTSKRVFVYLDPLSRDFDQVLQTLTLLGHAAIVCAPGISDDGLRKFGSSRIVISGKPYRLEKLLKACDLVICNAGHAMTAGMLTAGIPLLMLPNHLEQFLLGIRVAATGAGVMVNPDAPPPDYAAVIRTLLETNNYRAAAQHFAAQHADFDQQAQQERIVTTIEEIAADNKVMT